ncbi:MAG: hypothetical protein ACRD2J_17645 [Thermoanaerobaculia bacterium]
MPPSSRIALLVLLVSPPAFAAHFELRDGDTRLRGGEVCLFESGSPADPVERFTRFTRVTCHPAADRVAIPPGTWNLFARHDDGFVSREVLLVENHGGLTSVQMVEAARVPFASVEEGAHAAAYVEQTGAVIPLVPGEDTVLVPREATIFPLLISGGAIARIGPPVIAGRTVEPVMFPETESRDVAIGLVPDRDAFDALPDHGAAGGSVELTIGERVARAANRLTLAFEGMPALALFTDVRECCEGTVARVTGDGWFPETISLADGGPLRIAPATSLEVRWSLDRRLLPFLESAARAAETCPAAEPEEGRRSGLAGVEEKGLELTLHRCPDLQPELDERYVRRGECLLVDRRDLDANESFGTTILHDVAPGLYLLRLGFRDVVAHSNAVEIRGSGELAEIDLAFERWFGRVTLDGEPLHALVQLGLGGVADRETGEYEALRLVRPRASGGARAIEDVSVPACDGERGWAFFPDEPPVANARFDIELFSNELEAHVIDASTGGPLADARISYAVLYPGDEEASYLFSMVGATDENGRLAVADVASNRRINVCAAHDDYLVSCERVSMDGESQRTVTIALERAEARKGKLLFPAAVPAAVFWHRADGTRSESIQVTAKDGSFTYKVEHAPGEIVSVVSQHAPLYVFRQPYVGEGDVFSITYPQAPVRSFDAVLAPGAAELRGWFTIAIGDLVVPEPAFSGHLARRGVPTAFTGPGTIHVPAILETAPLTVILAPRTFLSVNGDDAIDTFYWPGAGGLPRAVVGSDGRAVIGE